MLTWVRNPDRSSTAAGSSGPGFVPTREAAQKAVREADRAAAELWSIQMEAYGGAAQPSPTIAQCLNGVYASAIALIWIVGMVFFGLGSLLSSERKQKATTEATIADDGDNPFPAGSANSKAWERGLQANRVRPVSVA
jgi:hypothetical protein